MAICGWSFQDDFCCMQADGHESPHRHPVTQEECWGDAYSKINARWENRRESILEFHEKRESILEQMREMRPETGT